MQIPESVYAHTLVFTIDDAVEFERRLARYGDWPPADVAMREAKRQEMIVVARNCAHRRAPEPRQTVRTRVFRRPRERQAVGGRRTRVRSPDDPDPSPDPPRPLVAAARRVEDSGDTDLNIVWREALDRFETADEFRILARHAAIRARLIRGYFR
jgi:hypothetical protein